MKPLLPSSSGKNIQGVILVEGSSVVSDPGCVAEVFSDYFANIIQLEHRSDTDYTDHPSVKAISNLRFSSELITLQSVLHISVTFWTTLIRERQLG